MTQLIIISAILLISQFAVVPAQDDTSWYWRRGDDSDTVRRTKAELDSLLELHEIWITDKLSGKQLILGWACLKGAYLKEAHLKHANFSQAHLEGAYLREARLESADFSGAYLDSAVLSQAHLEGAYFREGSLKHVNFTQAHLEGAYLREAHLDSADFPYAYLDSAVLSNAHLKGAYFREGSLKHVNFTQAHLEGAYLRKTTLDSADFSGAYLEDVDFSGAHLEGAVLKHAHLTGACLREARLDSADFSGAYLDGAVLSNAHLEGAIFEPKSLPIIDSVARAHGLKKLRYKVNPYALKALRDGFVDKGFKQQERDIICALRSHDAHFLENILFNLTSEYGSNLSRPWYIMGTIWLLCFCLYYISMLRGSWSRIRLILTPEKSLNIHVGNFQLKNFSPGFIRKVPMFLRLIWWAGFFSLMSAFNIGFRDINFGRWLRMLPRRKFDLEPTGWIRTISGFLALCSVYLIGLWVLSFAGTPFK